MTQDTSSTGEQHESAQTELAIKLDAAGWGLFFIWVGVAFLADVGVGAGLVGIGIITLGGQLARRLLSVRVERLWIVVGLLFLLGGTWALFEIDVPLVPVLFIVAGAALLLSALRGKGWLDRRA
jgi:putative Mn2+ efflux pump MntP